MAITAKNIYLADDDEDDRFFFMSALEEVGAECSLTMSCDGNELLRQLWDSNNPAPDIIFLDINMPLKNGLDCLAEIRANFSPNVPVVMFSTSDNVDYVSKAKKMGATQYLVKPSSMSVLKKLILGILTDENLKDERQHDIPFLVR